MDLSKLVAVSGKSGIYKLINNRSNGLILEDLDLGKKRFFSSRSYQFTPLDSISIYTIDETVALKVVFESIFNQLDSLPPVEITASSDDIKAYFEQILPEYDTDRVFLSDIKKIIKWFNFLHSRNLISIEDVEEETDDKKDAVESE